MKYGVIDVGSNSVRLMIWERGVTVLKKVKITKLGEGIVNLSVLQNGAMERTAEAIKEFVSFAKTQQVDDILIFATAAVRSAKNGKDFAEKVKLAVGYPLDIISGETEALLGLKGALSGKDGGIIDIGGASAEISVSKGGKIVYAKSLNEGVVRLTDKFGQDKDRLLDYSLNAVKDYGDLPKTTFYGVGGTATSLCACFYGVYPYEPSKTDGKILKKEDIKSLIEKFSKLSVEERKNIKELQRGREEVILSGAVFLYAIMEKHGIESITVSEKDNLEGYILFKLGESL